MSIHNKITKKIMIIELILICLLYIFPLGPYNADKYNDFLETPWFQVERLPVALIVGCCVSLILLKMLGMNIEKKCIKLIIVGILSIIEQIIIICGIYWSYKIYNEVGSVEREIGFAYIIGIFLLISSLILSVFIVLKIIACNWFIGILKRDRECEKNQNLKNTNEKYNAIRVFVRIFNNIICVIGVVFILTDMLINIILVGTFSWILFEIMKLLIIVIPMMIYLLFFVNKWIKCGKWINVIISYLWMIYLTYDLLLFVLDDFMFYARFTIITDWNLAEIVCAVVCSMLIICTIIMIICGIIDKRLLNKYNYK